MELEQKLIDKIKEECKKNSFIIEQDITLKQLQKGVAVLALTMNSAKHMNFFHTVHGGLLATMADSAMALACMTLKKKCMTVDMHISWLRAIGMGDTAYATGRVLLDGARNVITEAEIINAAGELCAKAQATFTLISKVKMEDMHEYK